MNFLFILSYSLCDARVGREALLFQKFGLHSAPLELLFETFSRIANAISVNIVFLRQKNLFSESRTEVYPFVDLKSE